MGALRSRVFWGDALERAVATAAQTVLAVVGADALEVVNSSFNAAQLITLAGFGFALSVIKSIAASQIGDEESASLLDKEK